MICLIFAHVIGDYALQPDWVLKNKGKVKHVLIGHCLVWTACVSLALWFMGSVEFWKILFLAGGHYWIDSWKLKYGSGLKDDWFNYADQLAHILQLFLVR